jgi:MraZ protein
MFKGIHNLTIDAKGRMKMPMKYQKQNQGKDSTIAMVLSIHADDNCLVLYPVEVWNELEKKIEALPSLNVFTKRLKRKLIGHATELEIDGNHRLLIPAPLREYAKMDKKIILSGVGKNFEIWDETAWHQGLDELDVLATKEDKPEALAQLSI